MASAWQDQKAGLCHGRQWGKLGSVACGSFRNLLVRRKPWPGEGL